MQSSKPGEEEGRETRNWHIRIIGSGFELFRHDGLLFTARIRRRSGRWRCQRFLHDLAVLVFGALDRAHRDRFLDTTPRETMRNPGQMGRECVSVGSGRRGRGNDSLPAADCGVARLLAREERSMKKRLIIIAIMALILVAAIFYLWAPGSAPPNQKPLLTLSSANLDAFQAAFDADADVTRLVLLLSPT